MLKSVLAKNTEIGKDYLLILSPSIAYKLTIKRIGRTPDGEYTSVSVIDERYPGIVNISPATSLLEWDEEYYNNLKKNKIKEKVSTNENQISKEKKFTSKENIDKKQSEGKKMARTVNPRSKVIDNLLSKVNEGQSPDFQAIASDVIREMQLPEDDRKKVIAQTRVRWYNLKKGKDNKSVKNS